MPSNRFPVVAIVLLVLAVAVGVFAASGWSGSAASTEVLSTPPPATGAAVQTPLDASAGANAAASTETAANPAERTVADPAAAPGTGSLLVTVLWSDKTPAADLEVALHRRGQDALLDMPRGRTDAAGSALFADLPPGNAYAQVERGDMGGGERGIVVAGQRTEVTITLKPGMDCKGRVVDERQAPVADARIVVSGWGGGEVTEVGRSGPDGAFALRAMGTHCHIGARKAGYLPSSQRHFTASEGSTVEFTIVLAGPGGALEGTVVDPAGRPVAGAVVRAGDREQNNHKLPDGASAMGPQSEIVRTDADGRFRFDCLKTGKLPVAARARGLAPWSEVVELRAGVVTTLTIPLLVGATLHGTVRDAAGAPLAGIEVRAGDWDDLGHRLVRSADDGTFRIEGLGVGKLKVHAEHDDLGKADATFELTPGAVQRWDPVLDAGLCVRGRVVLADGAPAAQVIVEAMRTRGTRNDSWFGFANTDADGRFVLRNCQADWQLQLTFRRKSAFPELQLDGVVPGPEELVVTLPKEAWTYVQGTVLGPDGEALPNVHASPYLVRGGSGSPAETVDGKTGAFRYGPYPPGTYALRFSADGHPDIRVPERTLGPDEVWDLGEMRFQRGGTLVAQMVGPGVEADGAVTSELRDGAGRWIERLETKAGLVRSGPLAPGNYFLQVAAKGLACRPVPFEVRAGRETRLDVPLQAAVGVTIVCKLPSADPAAHSVELVIRAADGAIAHWGTAYRADEAMQRTLLLGPGDYTVEATCGPLRATGRLGVADGATAPLTLDMR